MNFTQIFYEDGIIMYFYLKTMSYGPAIVL